MMCRSLMFHSVYVLCSGVRILVVCTSPFERREVFCVYDMLFIFVPDWGTIQSVGQFVQFGYSKVEF